MADNIKQSFTLDTSAAIASISQFNSAAVSMAASVEALAAKLQSFNGIGQQSVSSLRSMASAANSTASAFERLAKARTGGTGGTAPVVPKPAIPSLSTLNAGPTVQGAQQIQQAMKGVAGSVQTVNVGFATLGRVVWVQAIVRALSQLRNAFGDAIQGSISFQKQISEIGTIAGTDFGGTSGITQKVRAISDAFNVPIDTAAEAYYEALSNGVDKAAQAQTFMTDAAKFSKTAVTSLDNSVNLLTAATNAYGISTNQAGDIAGKFFTTIQLGRVRADDLANSFGNVANIAKESGISLDELLGGIATLTITGMKPANAMTALRSAASAFLKPSEDMSAALKELGFESGPAALQTLGFRNAILQLNASVNGSADGLAKLFPNIRALTAVTALSGQQADKFRDFTQAVKESGAALNDQKALEVMSNQGQQLTSELTKLHNALVVDFGGAAVQSLNSVIKLAGGAETLIEAGRGILPVIEAAGAALLLYGVRAAGAAAKNQLLGGSFGLLGKSALAIGAAVGVGNLLGDYLNSAANASLNKLQEQHQLEMAQVRAAAAEQLKIEQSTQDQRAEIILAGAQRAGQEYQAAVEKAKAADDAVVASAKSAGARIVSARQAIVEALGRAIDQSKEIQSASAGRVTGLQEKQSDRQFQFNTRHLSDARKYAEYISHSQDLAKQAAKQLQAASSTGNEKGIQAAIRTFGQAQHYGEQADQVAQRLNNRRKENDAMSNLTSLTKAQIAAEQQLSAAQEKRQGELDAERTAQQGILDDVKKNLAIVAQTSSAFDENNKPLSADKLAENNAKRQAALVNIIKAGSKDHDLDLTKSLGLARLATDLTRTPVQLAFDSEKGTTEVKAQLDTAFKTYRAKLQFDVSGLETALGKTFANPQQVIAGYTQAREELSKLLQGNNQSGVNSAQAEKLKAEIADIQKSSEGTFRAGYRNFTGLVNPDAAPAMQALDQFKTHFAQVAESAKITDTDIANLLAELGKVKDLSSSEKAGGPFGLISNQRDIEQFSIGLSKLKELQGLQQNGGANTSRVTQLESAMGTSAQNAGRLQTAAQQANASFASSASSTGAMASNLARAAEAARSAGEARIGATAPIVARAMGGTIPEFFSTGGRPRGTDRIPAMLSPGEFVVNARSARTFGAQLAAINAGTMPNYRANGGAVTNIGDIHVNVSGGQTEAQSARRIANGVRRELRRNTVKL